MTGERNEKMFFMVNDFVFHLYRNRKIDLKKYTEVLQLISVCSNCDAELDKVSKLFQLL